MRIILITVYVVTADPVKNYLFAFFYTLDFYFHFLDFQFIHLSKLNLLFWGFNSIEYYNWHQDFLSLTFTTTTKITHIIRILSIQQNVFIKGILI